MADGLLPINFVVNKKLLCFSEVDPAKILLPSFHQEDVVQIRFKALKHTSNTRPFLEKLNLSGYALAIYVGTVGSIKASALAWTTVDNGYALDGELNLNTADINTALGSNSSVSLTFEIVLSVGTVKYRMTQEITVKKSVAIAGSLVPVAGDTALGSLEAARKYAPLQDCEFMVWKDSVTGERMMMRIANGAPVLENIT